MKYVKHNDNNISKLSLGTVQFGLNYGVANKNGQPNQNIVNMILDYVFSMGINSFDTAQGYGNSEEVIGNCFKNMDQSNISVVSKIDSKVLELKTIDLTKSIQDSINKLRVDCLFGLLMHNSNLMDKWDILLSKKIHLLKQKNIIKYFGISIYSNDAFNIALDNKDIDIIQIPFNVFDQRAVQNKWFEKAKAKNKFIFIRSIYLQGLLLMNIEDVPEKLGASKYYIEILDDLSKDLGITKNELCLNFVNTVAKDASLLFGCETLLQAQQNLKIFNNMQDLNDKTIKEICSIFQDINENIYNPVKW